MSGKLGFGCMRLPLKDAADITSIDIAALTRMTDIFLERGFDTFDAAATYHDGHCEQALRLALVERYPRDKFRLADKLPTLLVEDAGQQEKIFSGQLRNCGVEYFDRYLVHCATAAFFEKAVRFDSFGFVERKKREGLVRETGFSFHDSPELLDSILSSHPEVDFVQLQINYVDWNHTPLRAQECYETARRHGKPVTVMCTLKGGMLADVPPEVESMFRAVRPDDDASVWALRYAASLEGVTTVLSGMSSVAEMEKNTSAMQHFEPFTAHEYAVVERAAEMICDLSPVQCTSCGYCVPTCPQNIAIPQYLHLYNRWVRTSESGALDAEYKTLGQSRGKASDCISCGYCESLCPQKLHIVEWLGKTAGIFERDKCPACV